MAITNPLYPYDDPSQDKKPATSPSIGTMPRPTLVKQAAMPVILAGEVTHAGHA